jgi:two-component system, sensor histidine kinase
MKNLLKKLGFLCVETAKNGKLGLEEVLRRNIDAKEAYSVILMDINMPVMCGYESATLINEAIKENRIVQVPIIAVTAQDSPDHFQETEKAGICASCNKTLTSIN